MSSAETPAAFWKSMAERFRERDRADPELPRLREEWERDRRRLALLVELAGHDDVARLAERVGIALRGIGVLPVERHGLHVTICEFGFLDRLRTDVETIASQVRSSLFGAHAVTTAIVGAASFPTAAILRVDPWDGLSALHRAVVGGVDEMGRVRGIAYRPAAEGGFAPHVTVAYYADPVPTADVQRALGQFDHIDPISIDVDTVSLVTVRPPVGAFFTWDVVEQVPLVGDLR